MHCNFICKCVCECFFDYKISSGFFFSCLSQSFCSGMDLSVPGLTGCPVYRTNTWLFILKQNFESFFDLLYISYVILFLAWLDTKKVDCTSPSSEGNFVLLCQLLFNGEKLSRRYSITVKHLQVPTVEFPNCKPWKE